MLTRKWTTWLAVWAGLAAVGAGLYALLWAQGFTAAAGVVSVVAALGVGGWSLRGLYVWRETPWVRRVNSFVIAAFAFGVLYLLLRAFGATSGARTTLYLFGTVAGFMLGVNLLRLILQPGWPLLGVARAMIEEAIRMKVALIFIFALLALLPVLPLILTSDDRLTYIVQRFLTYAIMLVSFLLSILTIILGAYTTSHDLKSKLVYMSLTKPLSRTQYLLGKWLGIVLLNAVLLTVSGVAIAGFTRALADGQAMNAEDKEQVFRELLVARLSQIPSPVDGTVEEMVTRTLANKQTREPERFGEPGTPASALPDRVRQEVLSEAVAAWFTINPGETTTYRFSGLTQARDNARRAADRAAAQLVELGLTEAQAADFVQWRQGTRAERPEVDLQSVMTQEQFTEVIAIIDSEKVQLVFYPYTSPDPADGMVELDIWVNGRQWPVTEQGYLPTKAAVDAHQEMSIPAWLITDEGVLDLQVGVPPVRMLPSRQVAEQAAVQLNRKDNVPEIYYRVGSFEGNLARSLAVLWVRLAFLAMVGLVLGALFSFPIACLAGLQVYAMAAFSGYLSEAVTAYSAVPDADTTWGVVSGSFANFFAVLGDGAFAEAFKLLLSLLAKLVMLLVPSFAEFNPGPALSEGHVVPTSMILSALIRIGLWTVVVTVLGLLLFHRRELAKITA